MKLSKEIKLVEELPFTILRYIDVIMLWRFFYIHRFKFTFRGIFFDLSATYGYFHTCTVRSDCQKSTCNPKVNDKELLQKLWAENAWLVSLGDWDTLTAEDNGELPPEQIQPGQQ